MEAKPEHSVIALDTCSPKARVMLINLNTYEQPYPVYPLGLAYIKGALENAGYQTLLWDSRAQRGTLEECTAQFAPDFIGLSLRNIDNAQSHNPLSFVRELSNCCERLRKITKAPLIVGGSAFSLFPKELLELTQADYGIQGEGEIALIELLSALRTNQTDALARIPGLSWRDAQLTIHCNPRLAQQASFTIEPSHDLDVLKAYAGNGSLIGVQTQRGCPLKCCYCSYPLLEGRRSRFRTGVEVAEEMERLASKGVRYAFIVDSVFNTRPDHLTEVCEAIIAKKIDMQWECFLRPRNITREQLVLMYRAGMRHVEFGSDSFCDPVLKAYGKSFTYENLHQISHYAHEIGIRYSHFLIFGGPGETPETVDETLRRSKELPGSFYFATIGMRIYPGTPLWEKEGPPKTGEPVESYLATPRFHIEPPLTVQGLYTKLQAFRENAHNWVVGDPPPAFVTTMEKLRQRGIRGPLWEFIEVLQRYRKTEPATQQ